MSPPLPETAPGGPRAAATLDLAQLGRAFPFHLHLDPDLRILSAGVSLRKACRELVPGVALDVVFDVQRPRRLASLADWQRHLGDICTLRYRGAAALALRGSAEMLSDGTLALLVAPVLTSMAQMRSLGLGFNDFAKHDPAGDLLLLASATQMSADDAERLAARLEARTAQLDTVLGLSDSAVLYFDADGRLLQSNAALARLLEVSAADSVELDFGAVQARLAARLAPDEAERAPLDRLATLAPTEPLRFRLARPRTLVIEARTRESLDGGRVYYLRDVTKESEVDRLKSEFLSSAAHELRTPMASIFGFTELLLQRELGEARRRELLEIIQRQSRLLIGIVNDLLDLARIEARRGPEIVCRPCALGPLIGEVLNGLRVPGDERTVQRRGAHDAATLALDADKFALALTNVLANAYKYSPDGGVIDLETVDGCWHEAPAIGVRVRDRGIGMTPEEVARVGERFFRADLSGSIPGTGLGMSLVKEIVAQHGGGVEIASTLGHGTEVTLWWPRGDRA